MGEMYDLLVLGHNCIDAGHDCIRMGNKDVEKGFVLICRTCKITYDIPTKEDLFAEVDREFVAEGLAYKEEDSNEK